MRLTVPILAALVLGSVSAAHAEPTSLRCADEFNKHVYFVTYDLQTNRLVFETPVGNIHRGEILATKDDVLELGVHARGTLHPTYDLKRSVIYWPGFFAMELGREAIHHSCNVSPDRTVLSRFDEWPKATDMSRRDPKDSFSIRCPGVGTYNFVTFDRGTKAVVFEITQGSTMVGEIKSIADQEIKFTLGTNPVFDLVWDGQKSVLTWIGIPDNPSRPTKIDECMAMKARSVMELYDRLPR